MKSLLKASTKFFSYCNVLNENTISSNIKNAQYAVRGLISVKADEMMNEMKRGKVFPFNKFYK